MRALLTTQPGFGHFHPLVPLAQALVTAGHEVAVACAPSFRPTVEGAALRAVPAGLDWRIAGMGDAFPACARLRRCPRPNARPWPSRRSSRAPPPRAWPRTCSCSPSAGAPM